MFDKLTSPFTRSKNKGSVTTESATISTEDLVMENSVNPTVTNQELLQAGDVTAAELSLDSAVDSKVNKSEEPTPEEAAPSETPPPLANDKTAKPGRSRIGSKLGKGASAPKQVVPHAVPIRILMGFLDNVTEQDALGYALGVAGNHFEQMGLATYEVFPYKTGYIYEVHEGGSGKAYTPSILNYFNRKGPFDPSEPATVVLTTATRLVQVQRTMSGISFVILPEGAKLTPTEEIKPTEDMRLVINKRTGYLVASSALFITGFLAMVLSGLLFRVQPFEVASVQAVSLQYQNLPIGQYRDIIQKYSAVSKVEFKNGVWAAPELPKQNAAAPASAPGPANPGVTIGAGVQASGPVVQPLTSSPVANVPPSGTQPTVPQAPAENLATKPATGPSTPTGIR